MSWPSAALALAGVLLVTFAPGGIALAVAGLRGLALVALAPAVSTVVVAAGATLAGLVGLPWSWPAGVVATALGAAVALALRRLLGPPDALDLPRPDRASALVTVGAAVGAALLATLPMRAGMGGIDADPQGPGAQLQFGVLRAVVATGHGSPLTPVHAAGAVVHPTGWHDLVSLAMALTGAGSAVAANAAVLVLAGLVVPLGSGYVSAALLPGWRWAAPLGMLAGTAFASLPTLVVASGWLWPYAWGVGLLPALLGAVVLLLRDRTASALVVAAVVLAGVAAAQRLALGSAALLAAPLVAAALLVRWHGMYRDDAQRRRVRAEAGIAVVAGLVVLGLAVLVTQHRLTAGVRSIPGAEAVGEALLDSPLSPLPFGVYAPAWLLGGLVGVGILVAVRTRGLRPWAVSWLLAVAMYTLACSALPGSPWRRVLTSWWLDDPIRLAALVPVVAAPLAVIALSGGARWLAERQPTSGHRRALLYGVLSLAVVAVLSLQRADVREQRMRFDYGTVLVAASAVDAPPLSAAGTGR